MADEWSKPVKVGATWAMWASEERAVELECGDVCVVNTSGDAAAAPRDVVLRLLAAEASDRLGWVWETMVEGPGIEDAIQAKQALKWIDGTLFTRMNRFGVHLEWRSDGPGSFYCRTANDLLLTELDIVASLMGRFLLEDAMKEGA